MSLPDVWFVIIAISWTVFFLLEGFDFGVGVLHRVITRSEDERRVAINTIGPFWDGNEVWLVVGGAAIFAAFPGWYATWFSAGYLALLVVLVALIMRGVSFEFRGKVDTGGWRGTWSGTLAVGSLVAPLVIGIALGDLVAGLPVDADQEFTGTFWDLFTPYGVWTGITLLVLCLLHGATYLGLRTTGELRERANQTGRLLAGLAIVVVAVFAVWTVQSVDAGIGSYLGLSLGPIAAVAGLLSLARDRDGPAFVATAVAMAATVGSLFASLYPNVLVSSTDASFNLTVQGTASGDYALKVMTVIALVFLPLVLLYQGWAYVVFRHRLTAPPLSPTIALDSN
jgi:cytochrome bd ubiquinol oxidase subunit II